MPKSRLRNGAKKHNKKVQKRTDNIKAQKAKAEREFMEMLKKAQEEHKSQETESNQDQEVENVVELGDIGDGLELDINEDK